MNGTRALRCPGLVGKRAINSQISSRTLNQGQRWNGGLQMTRTSDLFRVKKGPPF
jgi:hypothetical protein